MVLPVNPNKGADDLKNSLEKSLIEHFFPGTNTWVDGDSLFVKYELKDPDWHSNYVIGIIAKPSRPPKVYVLEPRISPSVSFHMYNDCSLCLYHWTDLSPFEKLSVVRQVIPWTIEWVHFYELWLVNGGIWKGKEIGHGL